MPMPTDYPPMALPPPPPPSPPPPIRDPLLFGDCPQQSLLRTAAPFLIIIGMIIVGVVGSLLTKFPAKPVKPQEVQRCCSCPDCGGGGGGDRKAGSPASGESSR